jgi:2-octaprenyl-6-methoxyphenol hydroxylase
MHDVVIVGAGPVGATLALALRDADLDIVVIDPREPGNATRGDRSLALSHGARLIFERLGIWASLAATPGALTPIVAIDISQARGFGTLRLEAAEQGLPALGYVVSYRALQQALDAALVRAGIGIRYLTAAQSVAGTNREVTIELAGQPGVSLRASFAAVADGTATSLPGISRSHHDYGQVALVANVMPDRPQHGVAYERFTPDGPVALLPARDRYALVWTQASADAARTLAWSDREFIAVLAAHFGPRAGTFVQVDERRSFPLALDIASRTTGRRVAVIGNAAQALHPIAGQGFNLGLRDAFELAQAIIDTPRADIGATAMLDRYRRGRRFDRRGGIAFTHGLVQAFGNDWPLLRVPRGAALTVLDMLPAAKRAFTRAMLFGIR